MFIDLRSDTFTWPSLEMRQRMAAAEVGDDYYGEDASVNRLEAYCRELFGKEAALFTTSGMLSNQLAIAAQVSAGNEVVTGYTYHVNLFESAQFAAYAHVVINGRESSNGVLSVEEVQRAIESKPRDLPYSQVELISIENTLGSHQGRVFPFEEIERLRAFSQARGIRLHMDGARLFNAHVAAGIPLHLYASMVDTLSVCFSKGLGAPFGSMLMGPREVIDRARRLRVWHGSGFHQIGIYADAAYFAITHHLSQLAEDHRLAKLLAERLAMTDGSGDDLDLVETNMVVLDCTRLGADAREFKRRCQESGLLVTVFPPNFIRLTLNRNIDEPQTLQAANILASVCEELRRA